MASDTGKTISYLDRREKNTGELSTLLRFYRDLLRVQAEVEARLSLKPTISADAIKKRLECGQPLVSFDELALDDALLNETYRRVVTVFHSYPDLFENLPGETELALETVRAWFQGTESPPEPLASIIHATLKPFLFSHAKALRDSVDAERWRRSYCPVCGGAPDFAYLEKEAGNRWLVCSRCDSEWLFQRLQCPFCGNQDQGKLAYFSDEPGLYRLYVCEKCRGYLKAIDLRLAKGEVMLPLERLETLDLDRQAQERGYTARPAAQACTNRSDK